MMEHEQTVDTSRRCKYNRQVYSTSSTALVQILALVMIMPVTISELGYLMYT